MVVEREDYHFDESTIEDAVIQFCTYPEVHTGTTRETALQAKVARINELVGIDQFFNASQCDESTVLDRLDVTSQTLVNVSCYDISQKPKTGSMFNKLVRTYAWVQMDICSFKGRAHVNAIKRELLDIMSLDVVLTIGDENIALSVRGEIISIPGKKEDAGYWRAILKIQFDFDIEGAV